ncbi:DegT/DnrJ/EryC1/StrS family aminotransferase [Nonomuraea fuscirosea]|uniref:DegT/DnrJ/EryC1/StrS family aminotransferase n=1 Tax=Nonomuraea fuscirosea TaxID=1291556 RepID=UPI0033BFEA62
MTLPQVADCAQLLTEQFAAVLGQMPDPSGGPAAGQLEHELAEAFGVSHAVAVSSGTAALHAALSACGIGSGDHVLVPALTVVMTVAPLVAVGATPVFVDSDPATLDLDYDDAARKVTARTRAIIPVHLWGRMGDPAALTAFAAEHGLAVIEDAAQAAGTERDGYRAGTVGEAGCFSMKDGKILWSGEGGFLLTARRDVAEHAAAFRSHWQPAPPVQTAHSRLSTNARLAAPLAMIALTNLRRLPALVGLRRAQMRHLLHALKHVPGLAAIAPTTREEWNGFAALLHIDLPNPRGFADHLAQRGVPNSTGSFGLVPCDRRPMFTLSDRPCRGAAEILDRTLAIVLTERDTEAALDRYATIIAREAAAWTVCGGIPAPHPPTSSERPCRRRPASTSERSLPT